MKIKKIIEAEALEGPRGLLASGELEPAMAKRVHALLRDLAAEDMEMAMLDLAQLSRTVLASEEPSTAEQYPPSVAICSEDGETLVGVCDGPEAGGRCPWAGQGGELPCSGSWLSTQGWQFKVAEEATDTCPVALVMGRSG